MKGEKIMVGNHQSFGYALIGCGAFGQFCLEQYEAMDELRKVAVADVQPETAHAVAERFGVEACRSPEALFARDDVDIVHVATPPYTHKDLVLNALHADKHVLCEKPLAIDLNDARELVDAARERGRVLAVNLIMRYNPLCETVKRIVDEQLLGEPLHGFFENYAKDEPLPPDHWFWKPESSGGIFVEHGVHFFDLFEWWLGSGEVVAAQECARPGTGIIEQVNCTAVYGSALVNFYHGFHQATRMDRQELRLVFERGSIRLFEWVPTRIEIDCIATRDTAGALDQMIENVRKEAAIETYSGPDRNVTSRHKSYEVDGRYVIEADVGMTKPELYGHTLCGLLADQLATIRDPQHERRVTEENGVASLAMAVHASDLAHR